MVAKKAKKGLVESAKALSSELERPCGTCAALRKFVQEIEAIGYRQVTTATLKAIITASDKPEPEWKLAK